MQIFLIIAIIVLYSLQTLFCTFFNQKYKGKEENASTVFCVFEGAFIVFFTLLWMAFSINATPDGFSARWVGFHFSPSIYTIGIGILNAVALLGYNTSVIKAGAKGSYAFMNVMMVFGGIIIPAVYEAFSGVAFEFHHYIAIGLVLISFVLMNYRDIKLKGTPTIYYIYCIILFVCNGMYGLFLKLQSAAKPDESNEMIIVTYGIMGIIAFMQLMLKEKKQTINAFKTGRSAVLPLLICLLIVALAINIYMLLIPLLGNIVTILYTVDNGGVLVLSALYAVIFFKEKPNALKIIGLILAVIGIITLAVNGESIEKIISLVK